MYANIMGSFIYIIFAVGMFIVWKSAKRMNSKLCNLQTCVREISRNKVRERRVEKWKKEEVIIQKAEHDIVLPEDASSLSFSLSSVAG